MARRMVKRAQTREVMSGDVRPGMRLLVGWGICTVATVERLPGNGLLLTWVEDNQPAVKDWSGCVEEVTGWAMVPRD